jgi:hypothetical protein
MNYENYLPYLALTGTLTTTTTEEKERFEKVSFEEYCEAVMCEKQSEPLDTIEEIPEEDKAERAEKKAFVALDYVDIIEPIFNKRGTYAFISPVDFIVEPGEVVRIPTGIKVSLAEWEMLNLYSYNVALNSISPKLENGHIIVELINSGVETIEINKTTKFIYGVFTEISM